MVINKHGETFEYEGTIYRISAQIIRNEQNEYSGFFGTITEIRDGTDKETENETTDIYCFFEVPVLPCVIKRIRDDYLPDNPVSKTFITSMVRRFCCFTPKVLR